jgi:hypothetical protein
MASSCRAWPHHSSAARLRFAPDGPTGHPELTERLALLHQADHPSPLETESAESRFIPLRITVQLAAARVVLAHADLDEQAQNEICAPVSPRGARASALTERQLKEEDGHY